MLIVKFTMNINFSIQVEHLQGPIKLKVKKHEALSFIRSQAIPTQMEGGAPGALASDISG